MFAHEGDTQMTLYLLFNGGSKRTDQPGVGRIFTGSFFLAALTLHHLQHASIPSHLSLLLYHHGKVQGLLLCPTPERSLVMADTLFACSCSIPLPGLLSMFRMCVLVERAPLIL